MHLGALCENIISHKAHRDHREEFKTLWGLCALCKKYFLNHYTTSKNQSIIHIEKKNQK